MKLISFIYERKGIRKILNHLGIFKGKVSKRNRAPPVPVAKDVVDTVLEPYDDGWPGYEEPVIDGQTYQVGRCGLLLPGQEFVVGHFNR